MKDIYGVHSSTQKSEVYTPYSHFFKAPSIVTTIERKAHAVRRRISVRALTPAAVKGLEGLILKNCEIFFRLLGEDGEAEEAEWGKGKNVTRLI
jgi:cytochrome P450